MTKLLYATKFDFQHFLRSPFKFIRIMLSYLIFMIALIYILSGFPTSCQPVNDHSTEEFDWKSFLADSPPQSPDGKSSSTSHKSNSLAENAINTPYVKTNFYHDSSQPNKPNPENHSSKLKRQRTPNEIIRRIRYVNNVKKRTGFSSIREAKLHHYRQLESNGTATEERKAILMSHRRKKRMQKRYSRAKKKIEQNKKD